MQRREGEEPPKASMGACAVVAGFLNQWSRGKNVSITLFPVTNRGSFIMDPDVGPFPLNLFTSLADGAQIEADYQRSNQHDWLLDTDAIKSLLSPNIGLSIVNPATMAGFSAHVRKDTILRVSHPGFSSSGARAGLYFDAYGDRRSQIGWAIGLEKHDTDWLIVEKRVLFH